MSVEQLCDVDYRLLRNQARALLSGQTHRIANAANLSALIFHEIPGLNWSGFYFLEGETLMLGPFQGKPACVSIPLGAGVCGTAAALGKNHRVENVHDFDGHIACDAASESEIVVPLFKSGEVIGVLDLDSPEKDRFSAEDEALVRNLARIYEDSVE